MAEDEVGYYGLCQRLCQMPTPQGQQLTYKSGTEPYLSHTQSYAVRNCCNRFYH